MRAELARLGVPGCSLALVDRAGRVWAAGVGLADLSLARPAEAETLYHLFSLTKLLTATAVLQLAEAGRLTLEDPLAAHLPGPPAFAAITLRQLLSHRSGLKDTLSAMLAVRFEGEAADAERALSRFRLVARRPPGRKVEYRNVNYALLGEVAARAAGEPFTAYVRRRILAPLGMKATFASLSAAAGEAATGYMGAWDPMRFFLKLRFPILARRLFRARHKGLVALAPYDLETPAIGGLCGSAVGFLPFLRAQLRGGEGVLGEASTALMQSLAARGRAGVESRDGVGLGWKLGVAGKRRFLNHEGGGPGFTAEARLYPEEGLGVMLAMNRLVGITRSCTLAHRIAETLCEARHALLEPG